MKREWPNTHLIPDVCGCHVLRILAVAVCRIGDVCCLSAPAHQPFSFNNLGFSAPEEACSRNVRASGTLKFRYEGIFKTLTEFSISSLCTCEQRGAPDWKKAQKVEISEETEVLRISQNSLFPKVDYRLWKSYTVIKCSKMISHFYQKTSEKITGSRQANLVLIAYASREGSGEPAFPRSLARISAARSYKQWVKRNPQTERQIPGPSEWLGIRS